MKIYTLQINYKSGISMQGEFTHFEVQNGTYNWKTPDAAGPVLFGVDNIESVWQINVREVDDTV